MRGDAIVKSFLAEHGTDMWHLFSTSLDRRRVALRAKLIRHLNVNGLNRSEISRVLDIDIGTVRYWLSADVRQAKIQSRRDNHERRKRRRIYQWWEECAQVLEVCA